MTDRDRLIELIQNAVNGCARHWAEIIADYLLANGVIVPPCKVGDTVYRLKMSLHTKRIVVEELEVERIAISFEKTQVFCKGYAHSPTIFGKTVFLTKEEAEEKLKELGK